MQIVASILFFALLAVSFYFLAKVRAVDGGGVEKSTDAAVCVVVVGFGAVVGIVFGVIPFGDDFVFVRLGLAAICRTILPLVILVCLGYTGVLKSDLREHVPAILTAYFGSIVLTVISAIRLGDAS
ncbi:MAG: hypothetical protein R3C03_06315 [Pirellulaceae bacterium]